MSLHQSPTSAMPPFGGFAPRSPLDINSHDTSPPPSAKVMCTVESHTVRVTATAAAPTAVGAPAPMMSSLPFFPQSPASPNRGQTAQMGGYGSRSFGSYGGGDASFAQGSFSVSPSNAALGGAPFIVTALSPLGEELKIPASMRNSRDGFAPLGTEMHCAQFSNEGGADPADGFGYRSQDGLAADVDPNDDDFFETAYSTALSGSASPVNHGILSNNSVSQLNTAATSQPPNVFGTASPFPSSPTRVEVPTYDNIMASYHVNKLAFPIEGSLFTSNVTYSISLSTSVNHNANQHNVSATAPNQFIGTPSPQHLMGNRHNESHLALDGGAEETTIVVSGTEVVAPNDDAPLRSPMYNEAAFGAELSAARESREVDCGLFTAARRPTLALQDLQLAAEPQHVAAPTVAPPKAPKAPTGPIGIREALVADAEGIVGLREIIDMTGAFALLWPLEEMRQRIADRYPMLVVATTVDLREDSPTKGTEIIIGVAGMDVAGMEEDMHIRSVGSRTVGVPANTDFIFPMDFVMCRGMLIHPAYQGCGIGSKLHKGRLMILAAIKPNPPGVLIGGRAATVFDVTMDFIKPILEAPRPRDCPTPEFSKKDMFVFTYHSAHSIVHMVHPDGNTKKGWTLAGIDYADGGPLWVATKPLLELIADYDVDVTYPEGLEAPITLRNKAKPAEQA